MVAICNLHKYMSFPLRDNDKLTFPCLRLFCRLVQFFWRYFRQDFIANSFVFR
jgi:hypothetical protein